MKTKLFSNRLKSIEKKRIMKNPGMSRDLEENICDKLKFTAAESYKLLRTNLQFSLLSEKQCKAVGITSALPGEGKSVTAINLAYVIAENNKRVLLVDADMRLSNVARQLGLKQSPGLSNVLAGIESFENSVQDTTTSNRFQVISAGEIPPNPSELLGSEQMSAFLEKVSADYDYIIVDLPPVNAVADALTVSEFLDGLLIVVRENYASRTALNKCMHQLSFCKEKVIGFVMTDAKESEKNYKKYNYVKNYYDNEKKA